MHPSRSSTVSRPSGKGRAVRRKRSWRQLCYLGCLREQSLVGGKVTGYYLIIVSGIDAACPVSPPKAGDIDHAIERRWLLASS